MDFTSRSFIDDLAQKHKAGLKVKKIYWIIHTVYAFFLRCPGGTGVHVFRLWEESESSEKTYTERTNKLKSPAFRFVDLRSVNGGKVLIVFTFTFRKFSCA